MNIKRAWAFQSFIICFLFNGILAGLIFVTAEKILVGFRDWVTSMTGESAVNLPNNVRAATNNVDVFLVQLQQYMAPVLAALVFAATFLLWLSIFLLGRRQINRAAAEIHNPATGGGDGGTEGTV